jgi:hypothetical protein
MLLAIASAVILGSESHGTHDHILLFQGSGSCQTLSRLRDELLISPSINICNFGSDRRENNDFNSSSVVSLVSLYVCVWISTIAPTERLGKRLIAETNTLATI